MKPFDRKVLAHILRSPGDSQQKIAKALKVDTPKVYGAVGRLVAAGQVILEREGQQQVPKATVHVELDNLRASIAALAGALA